MPRWAVVVHAASWFVLLCLFMVSSAQWRERHERALDTAERALEVSRQWERIADRCVANLREVR